MGSKKREEPGGPAGLGRRLPRPEARALIDKLATGLFPSLEVPLGLLLTVWTLAKSGLRGFQGKVGITKGNTC